MRFQISIITNKIQHFYFEEKSYYNYKNFNQDFIIISKYKIRLKFFLFLKKMGK